VPASPFSLVAVNVYLAEEPAATVAVANGPTFRLSRYEIWVSPTAPNGGALITASTTSGTPATTYTVTVTGKDTTGANHGLTHTTTFTLTVN